MISTQKEQEYAVLVGLIANRQSKEQVLEYLDELAFLVRTAGVEPVKTFYQSLEKPHVKHFVGSGKLEEIKFYITEHEISLVVFDDELSPTQLRNIENILNVRILDRTHLILDIFALRAQTAYAKTQVELAQYQYLLPRLTRMWTHLERQRGGIGLRGPGETEIETDRRIIRDKISKLKLDLDKIDRQMALQRKNRGSLIRVALVGYTNAGKSTIMNLLSKSEIFAEDMLFATLDTTVRKVVINNLPFLLSDTVGFIRKLPHQLVESFKSTLDETRESDLLLHIVDVSHPKYEDQIEVVQNTLLEIGTKNIPVLMVFNKIDAINNEDNQSSIVLEQLKNMWIAKANVPAVFISAKFNTNTIEFKNVLFDLVKELHYKRYPYNRI
jgi:GTP-binding protein HflX